MAEARPTVNVYSPDDKGVIIGSVALPEVFSAPIRPDVVSFVHTNMAKNGRQPYAVNKKAGHQTSAESWGTGRAVSRIPRVAGGGTQRSGQGAFGNMCRSGRMFGPTKQWRKWNHKINVNQRRYAVASALAASAVTPLVMARGHKVDEVPEFPLVIGGGVESIAKTAKAVELLTKVGGIADVEKVKASIKLRAGKGKMRNRRYTKRRGPLVVYAGEEGGEKGIELAMRALPGVDLCHVSRLNLLQLAPGGHIGRFVIWTQAAFEKLDEVYEAKKGFAMPQACMTNADVARLINSDEVQSIVNPAKEGGMLGELPLGAKKSNPLKNRAAMLKLNPYFATIQKNEMSGATKRSASDKAEAVKAKKARKSASKAFWETANIEGEVTF